MSLRSRDTDVAAGLAVTAASATIATKSDAAGNAA